MCCASGSSTWMGDSSLSASFEVSSSELGCCSCTSSVATKASWGFLSTSGDVSYPPEPSSPSDSLVPVGVGNFCACGAASTTGTGVGTCEIRGPLVNRAIRATSPESVTRDESDPGSKMIGSAGVDLEGKGFGSLPELELDCAVYFGGVLN